MTFIYKKIKQNWTKVILPSSLKPTNLRQVTYNIKFSRPSLYFSMTDHCSLNSRVWVSSSIQLYRGEQIMHEPEWRKESNCAGCKHDCYNHEERITQVKNCWDRSAQTLKVKNKIVNRVQEDIYSNRTGSKEGLPPPFPVFHTQMHVCQNQRYFSTNHH